VFRHVTSMGLHPHAELAAVAAAAQGLFWPMQHLLFAQAPSAGGLQVCHLRAMRKRRACW
jgi:hypothetical protein